MTALTPDHLAEVAKIARGFPCTPTKAVSEFFKVPHRTASYWLKKARELGVLGELSPQNWKAEAVANELGVDYDDLVTAIRMVGGDIRITGGSTS